MKPLNSMEREAQSSVEFMLIFVLFMTIITVVVVAVLQNTEGIFSSTLGLEVENTLSLVKSRLDTAYLEGSGFSTNFTLPQTLMAFNYSVNISSKFLIMEVNNQTYSKMLLTNSTTGGLRKGENMVKNMDGVLVIS
jgi:hypothetical protein